MNKVVSSVVVVAGLFITLGGAVSWGQVPATNDTSDGSGNTGGGTGALVSVTPGVPSPVSGTNNTAYGDSALFSTTSGFLNTAVGLNALKSNDTGYENTATGAGALANNKAGHNNTASGFEALLNNTGGYENTAFGNDALANNTTGSLNTATGLAALASNTTANGNTADGYEALMTNTTGGSNTASGYEALLNNTTGSYNTASGGFALANNTIGFFNTASGYQALFSNKDGTNNTASGYQALASNDFGHNNTALGYRALYQNSGGTYNLALGINAGYHLSSGDHNIYLGNTGAASESNTMRLGQVVNQTRTFIAGIRGVNVGSTGAQVFINSNGQLGTLVSSARYKRDIQDMGEKSQGVYQLRPVIFRYKQDPQGVPQYGLIAEQVATVYPELVTKGADGKVESVQYHELIPMLLNEVQRQQQKLETQAQELVELKAQNEEQHAQNTALAARLERLEQGATPRATAVTH